MLPNKEVESVQDEARISREFLALRKCHLNPKLLFLIGVESLAKQRAGKLICLNACSYWPEGRAAIPKGALFFHDWLAVKHVARTKKRNI